MCTESQLDTIFKILKSKKTIQVVPFDNAVFANLKVNVSQRDALDGLKKLQKLGFANITVFLNGNKSVEITNQGKKMYSALY